MFNAQSGGAEWVTQTGDVHYDDGQRQAFAQKGRYTPENQVLVMTGSPRVMDTAGVTTAAVIQMNRATGEADADKDVKTTYNSTKPQPTGAMLSSSSPVHVTAEHMHVVQSAGTARYTGNARLWQDSNIVEAPVIDFDHAQSSMTAQGTVVRPVLAVFVNNNQSQNSQSADQSRNQQTPVNITAQRLIYVDGIRKARFDGDVVMKSDQGTLWSDHLDVFLKPRNRQQQQTAEDQQNGNAGQIDRAVAEGHVILRQPGRKGTGDKLVYTSDDEKYVLTGDPEHQPEVDDVQRGVTRGDILTMYEGDDRVLVQSASNMPTYTQARVK
jgi:lipopolysaccharide export system protein LptA